MELYSTNLQKITKNFLLKKSKEDTYTHLHKAKIVTLLSNIKYKKRSYLLKKRLKISSQD